MQIIDLLNFILCLAGSGWYRFSHIGFMKASAIMHALEPGRAVTLVIRPGKLAVERRSESAVSLNKARVVESNVQGTRLWVRAMAEANGDHGLLLRLPPGTRWTGRSRSTPTRPM